MVENNCEGEMNTVPENASSIMQAFLSTFYVSLETF